MGKLECTGSKYSFSGTLLVCDMDGTLLNSKHRISIENYIALKDFVDNGGWFTVATGRTEGSVMRYVEKLPINVPGIIYNGAVIYDFCDKKVLWENPLGEEAMLILMDLRAQFPDLGIEVFHDDNIYFLKQNEYTEIHQLKEHFPTRVLPIECIPRPWYKVLLVWEPEKLNEVELFLKERSNAIRVVYSEPQFLELMNNTASKGYALHELVKILGISCSDVIAIGDNLNDLEMIKIAGTGIAVGNAHDELKGAAKFCCSNHNEHAISDALRQVKERKDLRAH